MAIDPFSWIPDSVKQQILDSAVDFIAEQSKNILGDQFGDAISQLKSDAKFRKEFNTGIKRATERFIQDYRHHDEDIVDAITQDKSFWQKRSVRIQLVELLKHPSSLNEDKSKIIAEFDDVLPQRLNRKRVDRAVSFFLQCLVEEVWHLSELRPIYELRLQKITAEKATEMVYEIQGMRDDVRNAMLYLVQTAAEKSALPEGSNQEKFLQPVRPKHNLPQPNFGQFVGRENEKQDLISLLLPHPASIYYVITILGVGGIGKSALALEIAHHYRQNYAELPHEERFDAIVWFSAKETVLVGDEIRSRWPIQKTIEELYATVASVFDREEAIKACVTLQEQDKKIRHILSNQRTLLILDNLETVDDERLLDFILHPPTPTKIVVTTRHWVSVAYPIKLEGMPHDDALDLIEHQSHLGNVYLSNEEKEKLIKRTGGIPLAIVWSIGLIRSGRPTGMVLKQLGNAKSSIARFIFKASVEQIGSNPAYNLLITLALFLEYASDYKVRQYALREELGTLAQLSDADRDEGLATLYQLSLINQVKNQFSLLPLTKSFALEELAQNSGNSYYETLRKRINSAVFELSQHTPFIYGTPVPVARHVNRQRELRSILSRTRIRQSTIITGEPRSGKTSLLRYVASPEVQANFLGESGEKIITVHVDANAVYSPEALWSLIIEEIRLRNLGEVIQEHVHLVKQDSFEIFRISRLFDILAQQGWSILLLLDEFELWLSNPIFNKPEFWGTLRSLVSRSLGLQIIIASTFPFSRISRLTSESSYASPFFNVFHSIELGPLKDQDVDDLIDLALAESQIQFNQSDRRLIAWLSGNHPYRVQVAGATLFDVINSETPINDRYKVATEQFYERTASHFDDLWDRYFDKSAKEILTFLTLIEISSLLHDKKYPMEILPEIRGYEFRSLERTGWIQKLEEEKQSVTKYLFTFDKSFWRVGVGGFILWLMDVINRKRNVEDFYEWLDILNASSGFLSEQQWRHLLDWVAPVAKAYSIDSVTQKLASRFAEQVK